MKYRHFITLVAAVCVLCGKTRADTAKPNILLIVSDDQQYTALGCAGHPIVKTPRLDRLAGEGVRFTHAFVPLPICTPSRAALLTGRFGAHNGVTFFGMPIREDVPTLPRLLAEHGYQTAATGKWHNDGRPITRGFDWMANVFLGGMAGYTNPLLVQGAKDKRTPVSGNMTELFADAAIRFLDEHDTDRPFFLYVPFTAPHDPREPPPEYEKMYNPTDMPLPANYMPKPLYDERLLDIRDEKLLPVPRPKDALRVEIAHYYGLITHMDAQIGRILDALGKHKLAENTIVIFVGDNGLALGAHGYLGKQNLYDEAVRVPLIIHDPRIDGVAGQTRDALVYQFDLTPTICEWAGVPIPDGVDGARMNDLYRGRHDELRSAVFARYDDVTRMVRTHRYKLIQHLDDNRLELFDLQTDPYELHNLADEPEMKTIRHDLLARLMQWRKSQNDESGGRGP